jgi:integrase
MSGQSRRRSGIGFTRRGDRIEATYNVPASELPEGATRKCITAHGTTKAQAQSKLLAKLAKSNIRAKANPLAEEGITFGEFLDEWIENYIRYSVQASTLSTYVGLIENHIKPGIGHIPLGKLTLDDIRVKLWVKVLKLKKKRNGVEIDEPLLGDFALNNLLRILKMSVEAAAEKYDTRISTVSKKFIKKRAVSRPEDDDQVIEATKKIRKLFYEELDRDDPRWSHFMLVLLGLRQAERLGLQLKSVHLDGENSKLRIYQQLDFLKSKGGWYLKDTTKNGTPRTIPIWGEFKEAIEKRLEIREKWSKQADSNPDPKFADLLFLGEGGKLITRRQDTPMWHSLGLEMRGHLARHITGHLFAMDNITDDTAKLILGHRSDAYFHYYRMVGADVAGRELSTNYRPGGRA